MQRASGGRSEIPRLVKPLQSKREVPFEKYAHFVVAPPMARHRQPSNASKTETPPPIKPIPNVFVQPHFPIIAPPTDTQQIDRDVDFFIADAASTTIEEAIERSFTQRYDAAAVAFWQIVPSIQKLYSNSYQLLAPLNNSLPGFAYTSRVIVRTGAPLSHPNYNPNVDAQVVSQDAPLLMFPLFDHRQSLFAVVEVVKNPGTPDFGGSDDSFVQYFTYKFGVYSRFLIKNRVQEPLIQDLLQLEQVSHLIPSVIEKLSDTFTCRCCEIWRLDRSDKSVRRYTKDDFGGRGMKDAGIVGEVLQKTETLNCLLAPMHASYSAAVDSERKEALLAVPVVDGSGRMVYAIVLRGPSRRQLFTPGDEDMLRRLAPFITLAVSNSIVYSEMDTEFQRARAETEGLAALLKVAEALSGHLDIVKLVEVIMEKGRRLTQADRCSLFLVNEKRDRLITSIQKGLENAIDIPIDKGVVGETVKNRKVLIIKDAYSYPSFDSSVDLETGYRTRSILSVPIFNHRTEVIGVTEMVNKQGEGGEFTKWDSHMIKIFNVFCGISLENAKLYQESRDMASQLRSFFDVSFSLSKSENVQRILADIIHSARQVIKAERASLFLIDESMGVLTSLLADGGKLPPTLPLSSGLAGWCATHKECIIVNNAYDDPRFNRSVDIGTGFQTHSLCVAPVVSSSGAILGVCEMINKSKQEDDGMFNEKDMKLLQSFATFASVSLENSRLKDLANYGMTDSELPKYISDHERFQRKIPLKLQLPPEKQQEASSLNFFAIDWRGIPEIQLFFYLFQKFNLFETYRISNEMFFRYLFELRSRYNDVPYHNWIHAGDVTEYLSYELELANLTSVLTSLEIFAMLVATTAHDTNHDGFNNIYNVKAETPLGILFKDQSVMETHHCTQLIEVLSKEEFNLLAALSPVDNKKVWTLMIRLILATDMAHHFRLVKQMTELLDGEGIKMDNTDHRLLVMQMLLKVADISNVSRPFELADKWCDVLCDEFFRQGDSERKQGIELTSPLNDRENSNKPKSQIGFYNFICIPLYTAVARAYPPLEVNLNSVKANLDVWKQLAAPPT
jgi:GAF domain-containing protein